LNTESGYREPHYALGGSSFRILPIGASVLEVLDDTVLYKFTYLRFKYYLLTPMDRATLPHANRTSRDVTIRPFQVWFVVHSWD